MRNFVLDIIVIELFSIGGSPSKRKVNIALSNQSCLSVIILVILVLLWCCYSYIVDHLPFLAIYLCSAYFFISGILQVVSEHLPRHKIVG